MHRKQFFFVAACIAVLLWARNPAFSQDSASQPDKPGTLVVSPLTAWVFRSRSTKISN